MKIDLKKIKQELIKKGLKRFAYIKVDLGTPLSLLSDEKDEKNKLLLKNKQIEPYDCKFNCSDVSRLKGINYGK
ncbi:MAG: hypothetical protein U9Q30_10625 [Campylobacterota bacterium]|nr:hypothetical protein [Campylobacterota bacterium]